MNAPTPTLRGRPPILTSRISIMRRTLADGTPTFGVQVREANGRRVYLGAYPDEQKARADAQTYIDTGAKPPLKKRGPKGGPRNPRRIALTVNIAPAAAPVDRIALMKRIWRRLA